MLHIIIAVIMAVPLHAGMQSTVTRSDITWTFDKAYPCGQYANGDYWVKGPVVITAITPGYDGSRNGWQVNPRVEAQQGFDGRINNFVDSLVPALPYTAQPGESVVKSVSRLPLETSCRPCLEAAAVLTVVGEVPEDSGATLFRPTYVDTFKSRIPVSRLLTGILPSRASVGTGVPTLETTVERFDQLRMDHKPSWTGDYIHPYRSMPEYGSALAIQNHEGALRLMLDDPLDDKMPALIRYVQYGIDTYYMGKYGRTWEADGGHGWGRMVPVVFAAVMLDDDEMKDWVDAAEDHVFAESYAIYYSPKANDGLGQVLYGEPSPHCGIYWNKLVDHSSSGSKTCPDPYGYIDGGYVVGGTYDFCCSANPMKQASIALHLFPEMEAAWNDDRMRRYSDRWETQGAWAQPDPCAPADGVWRGTGSRNGTCCTSSMESPVDGDTCILSMANFGVTFGDDPDTAGDCIRDTDSSDGIGRYPRRHGINAGGGHYGSGFADALWDAYRESSFVSDVGVLSSVPDAAPMLAVGANPAVLPLSFGFVVPRDGRVSVAAYNATGRRIGTVADAWFPAGAYRRIWSGPGAGIGDDVVCLVLEAGGQRVFKKVLLVE